MAISKQTEIKQYAVLNCIFLLDNQDLSYKNIILLLMYKNIVFKTNILLKKHSLYIKYITIVI